MTIDPSRRSATPLLLVLPVVALKETWYERPAARAVSSGGAWTMAWWCEVENVARFPTASTMPSAVLAAQLEALRAADIPRTYRLMSRARRFLIEEGAQRDMRETVSVERVHEGLAASLEDDCPGLLSHRSAEIVASLADPNPRRGLLPTHNFRVRIDGVRNFVFTLTCQSGYDGGDARDCDGYEGCWLVWKIRPDDGGGSARIREPVLT